RLVELDRTERRALGLALVRGHAGEGREDGTGVDAPFLGLRLVLDAEGRLQLRGRRHGRALVVVEDRVHLDQVRAGREGELADLGPVRLERAAALLDRRALEGVGEGELGARAVLALRALRAGGAPRAVLGALVELLLQARGELLDVDRAVLDVRPREGVVLDVGAGDRVVLDVLAGDP